MSAVTPWKCQAEFQHDEPRTWRIMMDWRIKVSVPFRVPLYRQLSRDYIFENENFTWKALKCDKKCAVSKQNNFVYS